MPTGYNDLDYSAKLAWNLFEVARTQVIMSPMGPVGLSVSAIRDLFDIYGIVQEERRDVFEYIVFMFGYVETRLTEPNKEPGEAKDGINQSS